MPRVFDFTSGAKDDRENPALFKPKPRWSWNPFHYLFVGWEYFAYFFAPPPNPKTGESCVYCWLMRLFVIGAVLGAGGMWWWLKR